MKPQEKNLTTEDTEEKDLRFFNLCVLSGEISSKRNPLETKSKGF